MREERDFLNSIQNRMDQINLLVRVRVIRVKAFYVGKAQLSFTAQI